MVIEPVLIIGFALNFSPMQLMVPQPSRSVIAEAANGDLPPLDVDCSEEEVRAASIEPPETESTEAQRIE